MSIGTCRSVGGIFAVAVAALSWGTVGLVGQRVQRSSGLGPEHIAFFRLAVAGICLAPFLAGRSQALRSRHRWYSSVHLRAGLFLGFNQLFYFLAIDHLGVATAALLTLGLSPVIASAFEIALDRALPTWPVAAALGLSLVGLVLLSDAASLDVSSANGALFSVLSALCFSLVALSRRRATGATAVRSTAATMGVAALTVLPLAMMTGFPRSISGWEVIGLGYIGAWATAIAYLLYFRGLTSVKASVALLVVLIEPVTASLLGVLIENERLGLDQLVGAGILLGGVSLATTPRVASLSTPRTANQDR